MKKKRDLLTRMAGYITAAASQVVEKRDFFDSMKSNAHRHTDTLTHTHTHDFSCLLFLEFIFCCDVVVGNISVSQNTKLTRAIEFRKESDITTTPQETQEVN